ncbi:MAG: hypothetical protein ACFCVF_01065 [Kineosporiaceae bacterium]
MPVVAVVVVPAAPLLLPELTGGQADDLEPVRAAVGEAVAELVASGAEHVTIAGGGAAGRLAGMGAPVAVPGPDPLPGAGWVHDLGRILLARTGFTGGITDLVLPTGPDDLRPPVPAGPGDVSMIAEGPGGGGGGRGGLLVLADGSITRGPRAPGGDDPRGADVDARIAADLVAGRVPRIGADEALRFGVRGLPGLALAAVVARQAGLSWRVTWTGAPAGVGYVVAVTTPSAAGRP